MLGLDGERVGGRKAEENSSKRVQNQEQLSGLPLKLSSSCREPGVDVEKPADILQHLRFSYKSVRRTTEATPVPSRAAAIGPVIIS